MPTIRKRVIDTATDLGGFYRANMGLRSALNVLKLIRSFNARNHDMLNGSLDGRLYRFSPTGT